MQRDREKTPLIHFPENKNKPVKSSAEATSQSPAIRSTPLLSFQAKKRRGRFNPRRLILPLLSLLLAIFLLSMYVEEKISPMLGELAERSAEEYLYRTVNATVGCLAREGGLDYDRMVNTLRDGTGQVIYLEVNTARLNEARSDLISRIHRDLQKETRLKVSVPLGSLTDTGLFGGRGLPVSVRVYAVGATEGDVYTVLEDCGINQTRHLMCVKVRAKLYLVLPGEDREVSLEITLPLGERVLVGDVPEIYLDTIGAS
ncbi:MAG: sporulation protein YunB [Clostridia bacterium]|nr:sporulation protein YunB [Clostridia bacterium]